MDTGNLQQSFLEAIDLVSKKIANSTDAPKTIKAEIVALLDKGANQYSISYGGAVYTDAYATANMTYEPSTVVFVLVPEGDFDSPKVILNAVNPGAETFVVEDIDSDYISVTDNLLSDQGEIKLCSWDDSSTDEEIKDNEFTTLFSNYLKNYNTFCASFAVKTDLDIYHRNTGNYGLKLILPFKQKVSDVIDKEVKDKKVVEVDKRYIDIEKEYVMDVSTMTGDPYNFDTYSVQSFYYTLDDTLIYDTSRNPKLVSFVSGFGYTDEDIKKLNGKDPDILIKDFGIKMVDKLSEEDKNGYYLTIVSNYGINYPAHNNALDKTLTPLLKVNGKTTSYKNYDCYWFVQDASIDDINNEYYSQFGGFGWRCLNKKTDVATDEKGQKTYKYVTNNYNYIVKQNQVLSSLRFKCVLTKSANTTLGKDIFVKGEIELFNLNSIISTSLVTTTGSSKYVENIGKVNLIARYKWRENSDYNISFKWQRFDKDNQYIDNDFFEVVRYNELVDSQSSTGINTYETEISFNTCEIEKSNTIYCTFIQNYVKDGKLVQEIMGTNSIVITTSNDNNFIVTIEGGDKVYKYDNEGNAPNVGDYDGPISSIVKTLEPLSYKIYNLDGTEFTRDQYAACQVQWRVPKTNSMLSFKKANVDTEEGDYYIKTNYAQVDYDIQRAYRKDYINNTVFLDITFNGDTITTATNIKFIKDGEGGTNGSRFTAYITYRGYGYGEKDNQGRVRKFQAVYVNNNKTWNIYNIERENDKGNTKLVEFSDKIDKTFKTFGIKLYKDSVDYTAVTKDVIVSIDWSMFDSSFSGMNRFFNIDNNGILSLEKETENNGAMTDIKWDDVDTNSCNVIQAKITVGNQGMALDNEETVYAQEIIYAYYPIELVRIGGNIDVDNSFMIPTVQGGYEQVLYNSGGLNPSYAKGHPFVCVDSLYQNSEYELAYVWETSSNLKAEITEGKSNNITPVTYYDHAETNNYVKIALKKNKDEVKKANDRKKELEEEKTAKEGIRDTDKKIVDGRTSLSDFPVYLNIFAKSNLDEIKQLLSYREKLLSILSQMIDINNNYNRNKNDIVMDINKQTTLYSAYVQIYNSNSDYKKFTNDYHVLDDMELDSKNGFSKKNTTSEVYEYGLKDEDACPVEGGNYIRRWNDLLAQYNKIIEDCLYFFNMPPKDNTTTLGKASNEGQREYIHYKQFKDCLRSLPGFIQGDILLAFEFANLKSQLNIILAQLEINGSQIKTNVDVLVSYAKIFELTKQINTLYTDTLNCITKYNNEINSCNNIIEKDTQEIKEIDNFLKTNETDPDIIFLKPIVMLTNRYELSYLRDWDGSKLYVDDQNDAFLFAPQLGAGYKKGNAFTGLTMGVKYFSKTTTNPQQIGLIGYSEGAQTLFINAKDGSAIFGKSGSGQIILDPKVNQGLLYNSSYFTSVGTDFGSDGKPTSYNNVGKGKSGLLIKFTETKDSEGKITSGPFIHFGDATGKIYSGEHDELNNNKKGFYLSHDGLSITGINDKGVVSKIAISTEGSPIIYSSSHDELGKMDSGFYLGENGLSIGNSIRISAMDNNGLVEVGKLSGKHWTIKGASDGNYSYIGYNANTLNTASVNGTYNRREWEWNSKEKQWEEYVVKKIPYNYLTINGGNDNSVYLGTDGIRLGKQSAIDNNGNSTFTGHINAVSGTIGGWSIVNSATGTRDDKEKSVTGALISYDITKKTEKEAYEKGYVTIEADGDIFYSKELNSKQKNEKTRWWCLHHDGTFTVDSINSFFGGVKIENAVNEAGDTTKCTHYESQRKVDTGREAGVFQQTCHDEILEYIKKKAPAKGIPYRVAYHPATSSTAEYWDVTF